MEKLNDNWLRLLGIPLVAIAGNFIFYQPQNDAQQISRVLALTMSLAECMLQWELCRLGILLARRRFPLLNQTHPRIWTQVGWFVGTTIITRVALTYIYDVTQFWGYPLTVRAYWVNMLVPFLFSVPIAAIYEARYLYRKWWVTYHEAEKLKKEQLQSQLNSLKHQLNPHFLFNSLSTLSSLVTEDPVQAERFINELASVYRYVLQTNNILLTTLEQELQFIQAYLHLLQTRFGKGVQIHLSIDHRYLHYLVPPLTLQLLVENAVKHNRALPSRPLAIRIFTAGPAVLTVANNLQQKHQVVGSNGVGLANIRTKYRLIRQAEVLVEKTETQFAVHIPLIVPGSIPAYAAENINMDQV